LSTVKIILFLSKKNKYYNIFGKKLISEQLQVLADNKDNHNWKHRLVREIKDSSVIF
jgi:hypothetical protein